MLQIQNMGTACLGRAVKGTMRCMSWEHCHLETLVIRNLKNKQNKNKMTLRRKYTLYTH